MDEFNKRCAEVLGWKLKEVTIELENPFSDQMEEETGMFYHKDGDLVSHPYNISTPYTTSKYIEQGQPRFHDSYDWAMLLVKECDLEQYNHCNKIIHDMERLTHKKPFVPTPHQIAQAALEVLETNNE